MKPFFLKIVLMIKTKDVRIYNNSFNFYHISLPCDKEIKFINHATFQNTNSHNKQERNVTKND